MRLYRRDFGPYFWDSVHDRLRHLKTENRSRLRSKAYKDDVIIEWVYDNLNSDFNHRLIPIAIQIGKLTTVKLFMVTAYNNEGLPIQTIKAIGYSRDIRKFRTTIDFFYQNLTQSRKQIAHQLRSWKKHTKFYDPKRGLLIPNVRALTKQFYLIEYKLYKQTINNLLAAYKKPPYKSIISHKYISIKKYVSDNRIKDIPLTKKIYEQYRLYFQQDQGTV